MQISLQGPIQVRGVQVSLGVYLLNDFLTGVSLSVLHNGVCVPVGETKKLYEPMYSVLLCNLNQVLHLYTGKLT